MERFSRPICLITGVLIVPFALAILVGGAGELTASSAVRMAFAGVAGQTVAVLTALVLVVDTLRRREQIYWILLYGFIAAAVGLFAYYQVTSAAELLLTRLDGVEKV
ncbi:hypothetical protein L687_07110 [Microbacterium maritypicum MF109]|uniref:Uncharacterized protein n=1 Tax=Microbacterium maritypicum MF109 TaxID=1333857 RepID=T5K1F1_MICMQ|nr:hypothetical protein L687_07110 [Microbacterium maritypicum MF109]